MYEHATFTGTRLSANMVASPSTAISAESVEILLSLMSAGAAHNEYVVTDMGGALTIEQMPRRRASR